MRKISPSIGLFFGIIVGLILRELVIVNVFIEKFPNYMLFVPFVVLSFCLVIVGEWVGFILSYIIKKVRNLRKK